MVFSSMVFLWIFLPVCLVLTRIFRNIRIQNYILLAASLFFYAWGEPRYIFLMLVSIFMNWGFGMLIASGKGHRKLFLVLDVAANLGLLGYYKYANFVLNTLDHLFPMVAIPRTSIALPIGISFFTFQAMSYVIDLYRGRYQVQKNPLHLALYISFFPQLIAGPIVQYKDIEDQILVRQITAEKTAEGIRRFLYGLGKKVIIANLVAIGADALFGLDPAKLSGGQAWAAAILYSLQIYYDFSGYSDMAIGLGKMFGFTFLENFNYPYISASVQEFWRRWHISLSSWFRDYLYIPLGGNRKGKFRTYINLFIVFACTGLWHGASWNFVGWGLYHGFFLIVERMGFGKVLKHSRVLSRIYALLVAVIGWVFFRVESVHHGLAIVERMLLFWRYPHADQTLGMLFTNQTAIAAVLGVAGCGLIQSVFSHGRGKAIGDRFRGSLLEAVWLVCILAVSLLLLANNTYNPFIYFRF